MTDLSDKVLAACQYQSKAGCGEHRLFVTMPDGVLRPGGLTLTRRMVAYCHFRQGARVVDVGCGTGITVEYLRKRYRLDAVGVDLSAALLRQGRERAPGLPLIQAAGERLPFADGSVAGVVAECSLSVMQDAGEVLAECSRILVPGGKLAISDLYLRDVDSIFLTGSGRGAGGVSGIITYADWAAVLAKNGFHILVWEDQSSLLKAFVARFIMEHGSVEQLRQCLATRMNNRHTFPAAKLGYFLLVAEKH